MSQGRSGNFLYPLLHLVWPTTCPVCGRLGELVCEGCLRSLLRVLPAFCLDCGRVQPCGLHREGVTCFAGSAYRGACRQVVHTMKYRNGRQVARRMGRLLAEALARPSADFLVPIPLHGGSEREYNQAELIAEGAGDVWHIPVRPVLAWRHRLARQVQKAGDEERALPADSIGVKPGFAASARVFLVDDVYTTGSTMCAARDALLHAGMFVAGAMVWSRRLG